MCFCALDLGVENGFGRETMIVPCGCKPRGGDGNLGIIHWLRTFNAVAERISYSGHEALVTTLFYAVLGEDGNTTRSNKFSHEGLNASGSAMLTASLAVLYDVKII